MEELMVRFPVALNQCMPDEELAGQDGIHTAVVDPALRDDGHAVERDLLVGHHRAHLGGPVRFAVSALDEFRRNLFGPNGIELGGHPCPETAGFHQLRRHDERRRLLEQG